MEAVTELEQKDHGTLKQIENCQWKTVEANTLGLILSASVSLLEYEEVRRS